MDKSPSKNRVLKPSIQPSIQDGLDNTMLLRKRASMTAMAETMARGTAPNREWCEAVHKWSDSSPGGWAPLPLQNAIWMCWLPAQHAGQGHYGHK